MYSADFGNIPNPSAMTFTGWFKFDNLTENKIYPLFSVKTVKQINVDSNLTTFNDLFRVYLDKKIDSQQLFVEHLDDSLGKKLENITYTPVVG